MYMPLITIGITSYNAHDTIKAAVNSALSQKWPNFEIVIVDDNSTDETIKILKQLEKKYTSLTIIFQEKNLGVAASRNTIIKRAKGDFIAFFDDDDISDDMRLEKQYQRIVDYERNYADHHCVISHTSRKQIYPNGLIRIELTMGTGDGLAPNGVAVAQRILTGKPVPNVWGSTATCSQMARTSTYRTLEGFDESYKRSEDTDFNVRAAMKGAHFVGIEQPLVTQIMTLTSDKKLSFEKKYALQLLDKHKTFINTHYSYNFCYGWICAKYDFLEGLKARFVFKLIHLALRYPILTTQRLYWAMPNVKFNFSFGQFYNEK